MKLQINVSDAFGKFTDKLVDEYKRQLPDDQKSQAPRSANQLIPFALIKLGLSLEVIDPDAYSEAIEITMRKPGPRKKDNRQLTLIDDLPGVWVSSETIATGDAVAECGSSMLELHGCFRIDSAAQVAMVYGWGSVPEKRNGVVGIRFIPPGTSLAIEQVKPPKPNLIEVGVFISEAQIQAGPIAILANGRVVPRNFVDGTDKLGSDVIRFQHAKLDEGQTELSEATQLHELKFRTEQSFRIANADAVEIGWTVRRESRRDKRGFRYIPPGTKLRFVLPEQEVEVD